MIYLDNASTTKVDERVIEAMMPYLTDNYGNAGTLYGLGIKSKKAIQKAREQVADFINAEPEQIVFTSGGTESNNMVFLGTKKYLMSTGKTHIITTQIEHESILHIVDELCKPQHIVYENCIKAEFDATFVKPNKNSYVHSENVIDAIKANKNTGIVSVMHTNNETGLENKGIKSIGKFCRENGILFHTDCVQAASCYKLDVKDLMCDFMSLSSHKIHGVKGVGALYVRDKSVISPIICGGNFQEYGLRGGTENVAGIVAFGKACEIQKLNFDNDIKHIVMLRKMLYNMIYNNLKNKGLEKILHINGYVDLNSNGKVLNLRFDGIDAESLLMMLDIEGVCVSAGSACRSNESKPSYVLTSMGIDAESARSSIRISLSRMNNEEEIKQAANIISDCIVILYK